MSAGVKALSQALVDAGETLIGLDLDGNEDPWAKVVLKALGGVWVLTPGDEAMLGAGQSTTPADGSGVTPVRWTVNR